MAAVKGSVPNAHLISLFSKPGNAEGDNTPSLGCGKKGWETYCTIFQSLLDKAEIYWEIWKAKSFPSRWLEIPARLPHGVWQSGNAICFISLAEIKVLFKSQINYTSGRDWLFISCFTVGPILTDSTVSLLDFYSPGREVSTSLLLPLDPDLDSFPVSSLFCEVSWHLPKDNKHSIWHTGRHVAFKLAGSGLPA